MKYSLGLDIGTVSVGWAVINLDKKRIEDLGVRIFEKPEQPKSGKSLAEPRRIARGARRRLRRRRQRLNYLQSFFIDQGLLSKDQISNVLDPKHNHLYNPYNLRTKGLSEQLTTEELFVALYHIAKRRGYKSNRKSVQDKDSDDGKVLKAISANKDILAGYQSVGQALNCDSKFSDRKRNKAEDYRNSFIRSDFEQEIKAVLSKQQQFYPQLSDDNIQLLLLGDAGQGNKNGLFYQRPFMTKELINKMRGHCQLEHGEPRAPKASYSFEIFRLAQDLSHLTYSLNLYKVDQATPEWKIKAQKETGSIHLTGDEIKKCLSKCLATRKVTYRAIRETIGYKNDPNFKFTYIRGKQASLAARSKDPDATEKNVFAELKFYHDINKALTDLPDWNLIKTDPKLFDQIGDVLSCNKDDHSIHRSLSALGLSEAAITNLLKLSYTGFGHLSIKAIRKITPFLLLGGGMTYDKAMVEAGYTFAAKLSGDKNFLPPLNEQDASQITNPVVKRAISQTIKVVNAIIRKHGQPYRIGVECANDLAKNADQRQKIKKRQDENAAENEKVVERLKNDFNITNPTGLQITKYRFYQEQDAKCVYSGEPIDIDRLFSDRSYCEIDHIIPFSLCGNDSRSNKVLVLNKCNQEKGNRTPFQTWGSDTDRWREFEVMVNANPKLSPAKKDRLLATEMPTEAWRDHAINDTRYISRFISQYLKNHLSFAPSDDGRKQKVILPAGSVTSFLRRRWHLQRKNREADCLHHSVDAIIVALVDQGTIADCAKYSAWLDHREKISLSGSDSQAGSLCFARSLEAITDKTSGLIDNEKYQLLQASFMPWTDFAKEVSLRESQPKQNDSLAIWRDQFRDLYKNQDNEFVSQIRPIFVSRMPKRSIAGQANKETLRSPKTRDNDGKTRSVRMKLKDVKLKELENSATKETDPELYERLKERLEVFGDDPKKAFDMPVYKAGKTVDKNSQPISPVSTIKVYSANPDSSGFLINRDCAYVNNGSMVRLDAYQKTNKDGVNQTYFVPVYAHQVRQGHPEIRPTRILPNRKRDPDNVDASFTLVNSIFSNDYIKLKYGDQELEGYYVKYQISTGNIYLLPHISSSKNLPKKGEEQYASMFYTPSREPNSIQIISINVLGDNYPWK